MEKKEFTRLDYLKFGIFLILFFAIVILLLGEVITRLIVDNSPYKEKAVIDEELGWVVESDNALTYTINHYQDQGAPYLVNYRTGANGFREWGDTSTNLPKVLFIGDSYVQAVEVSNEATFYKLIADSLGIEIFAYGSSGYGTLQELMILKKHMATIKPDLIVLQTCSNDFVDNHPPMEYLSNYKVGLRRPYYDLQKNIYYNKGIPNWQERIDKSAFLKIIRKKLQYLMTDKDRKGTEQLVLTDSTDYKPFRETLDITQLIIDDFKSTAGSTPLIAWSASTVQPYTEAFAQLFENAEIPFHIGPAKMIDKVKWHGQVANSSDGYHWNELGHRTVAAALIEPILSGLNKSETKK